MTCMPYIRLHLIGCGKLTERKSEVMTDRREMEMHKVRLYYFGINIT